MAYVTEEVKLIDVMVSLGVIIEKKSMLTK